jgi:hypothetical protein
MVVCQSSTCPNGNPPSRLECPTCNKSVVVIGLNSLFDHFHVGLEFGGHFSVGRNASNQDVGASLNESFHMLTIEITQGWVLAMREEITFSHLKL